MATIRNSNAIAHATRSRRIDPKDKRQATEFQPYFPSGTMKTNTQKGSTRKGLEYVRQWENGRLFHYYPKTGKKIEVKVPKKVTDPGTPATPAGQTEDFATPRDATYYGKKTDTQAGYDASLSGLAAEEQAARQDYGFDDKSNPFSRKAEFDRASEGAVKARHGEYAARGSLFSGAFAKNKAFDERDRLKGEDALRREYDALLQDIGKRKQSAQSQYERDQAAIEADSVSAGVEAGVDPETVQQNVSRFASDPVGAGTAASTSKVMDRRAKTKQNFKTVVKDGKVYHYYEDGRKVYVRPAITERLNIHAKKQGF